MTNQLNKYNNRYRVPSARAPWWNYHQDAAYFITICTQHQFYYFGEIEDGEMQLSEIGKIVETEWIRTIDLRPDMNISLGNFVIMPNHFHAIIVIGKNQYNESDGLNNGGRDAMHCVSTITTPTTIVILITNTIPPPATDEILPKKQFTPQSKNLSSVIRGFKSSVTASARKIDPDFKWQPRFYDRIIRHQKEYQRIENYINQNPLKWNEDKFYSV